MVKGQIGEASFTTSTSSSFDRVIDDGPAHYTFDFEYDIEKSDPDNVGSKSESKKKYLLRVKSTLRIVLQVRGSKARAEN